LCVGKHRGGWYAKPAAQKCRETEWAGWVPCQRRRNQESLSQGFGHRAAVSTVHRLVDESMASRCQPCSVSRIELTAAYTHSGYSARSPYLDTKCDPSGHHICIVIAHCSPEPPHSLDLLKCEHAKVPGSGKYIYDSRLRTDTISSLCHRHVKRVCSNCLLDCPSDLDLACRLDTLWESRPGLSDRSCIRPTCNPSLAFSHPPLFEDWRAMKWMLSGDSRRMDSCS
jgi:hypothetical protein